MTRNELIDKITISFGRIERNKVDASVTAIVELMTVTLAKQERIEIRGFGSFSNHIRTAKMSRNPKTGEPVMTREILIPHFKPGKELKERVNATMDK